MGDEPRAKRAKPSTTPAGAAMAATVATMDGSLGFDAVVVCTSNAAQEAYWQERLERTRGQAAKKGAVIVAVHEDWASDGAGNGLGTLYAYAKARAQAMARVDGAVDLDAMLAEGKTVGIYHTAGKGTRLAPLPGAENNNKPGVKLPSLVTVEGARADDPPTTNELTILEAVIRQTGCYAPRRAGRCSVFWGDQIFVPSAGHLPSGAHHADILARMGPMPTEEEWAAHGDKLPSDLARRAKHFFDENRRAKDAVRLWRDGDVKSFGALMNASGASSVENYECGCEEITTLWNIVKATEGVFGARFSGAGFRGCVVALCEPGRAAMDAAERIAGEYARVYPELAGDAPVIVTRPGRGAFILRGEDR